jgi:predicted ATPase
MIIWSYVLFLLIFETAKEISSMLMELSLADLKGEKITLTLSSFQIPESISDLIIARIDLLPVHLRQLLRSASILGYYFSSGKMLNAVYEIRTHSIVESLETLISLSMIQRLGTSHSHQFAFSHQIAQESIYDTITIEEKMRKHATIAQLMESEIDEDTQSQWSVVAHHWRKSNHSSQAAKAFLHAAFHSFQNSSFQDANTLASEAVELSSNLSNVEIVKCYSIMCTCAGRLGSSLETVRLGKLLLAQVFFFFFCSNFILFLF